MCVVGVLPGATRAGGAHGGGDAAARLLGDGVAGAPAAGRGPRRGGAQVGAAAHPRPLARRHHCMYFTLSAFYTYWLLASRFGIPIHTGMPDKLRRCV